MTHSRSQTHMQSAFSAAQQPLADLAASASAHLWEQSLGPSLLLGCFSCFGEGHGLKRTFLSLPILRDKYQKGTG